MLNLVQAFWDTLWHHPFRRRFLCFLLVVNAIGAVSGYFWYENQLATTPWRWWIFVPDSPLSATIFTLALAGWLAGRRWPAFYLLACASVIKYGIWAVILISEYWWRGGAPTFLQWMLWLSHIGMAVEGLLYLRHLRLAPRHVVTVGIWLLLNDWADYGWGFHPYLYRPDQWALAAAAAVILTVALIVVPWKNIYSAKQEI